MQCNPQEWSEKHTACQTFIITFEPEQRVRLTDIIKQGKKHACPLPGCWARLDAFDNARVPLSHGDRHLPTDQWLHWCLFGGVVKNMMKKTPIKPLLCVHILLKMILFSRHCYHKENLTFGHTRLQFCKRLDSITKDIISWPCVKKQQRLKRISQGKYDLTHTLFCHTQTLRWEFTAGGL